MRHTYASILLSVVEAPITYVQRQLGHTKHPADRGRVRAVDSPRQAVRGRLAALATNGDKTGGAS
ncbi:MAG: hypothetical protein E6J59_15280 [Deltaproteobacteria bacterium]|nr:MAG: hypothetical protein E6J59_15280 [Deltaproteobacteria bacterium]